jgi:hypothetical protein
MLLSFREKLPQYHLHCRPVQGFQCQAHIVPEAHTLWQYFLVRDPLHLAAQVVAVTV